MNEDEKETLGCLTIIVITIIILVVGVIGFMSLSQSGKRALKSWESDYGGGLNRIVTVYDYEGDVIKQWKGKFDLEETDQEIYFDDQNNKRVIIQGGIVIVEEQ